MLFAKGEIARWCAVLGVLVFCTAFFLGQTRVFASSSVERLSVTVQLSGGRYDLPAPVKKRMQAGIYTIADNVLLGRQVEEIKASHEEYAKLIQEVFDRIVMGYTVKHVSIEPGEETKIDVMVTPWQDVIEHISLTVDIEQVPDAIKLLVLRDTQGIEDVFSQLLVGMPMDAVEWTNGIIKSSLQVFLDARLPEFHARFEIIPGEMAQIKVILYPKGDLIRDIDLSLRSDSIPNAALLTCRPHVQERAEVLLGLPVRFVERHKIYFQEQFAVALARDHLLKSLGVKSAIVLKPAVNTTIDIVAETEKYHIFAEGYLDIGREEENTSVKLHLGKYISSKDEVFLETDFFPHKVKWVFMPGLSRKLTPKLTLGYQYNLDEHDHVLWVKQKLGERFLLRVEHMPDEAFNAFALRYKLNDFFGLEYVVNDDDQWLRMVGNF